MVRLLCAPEAAGFRELVGPRGGGTAAAREAAVARVAGFLGNHALQPGTIAERIFSPGSATTEQPVV